SNQCNGPGNTCFDAASEAALVSAVIPSDAGDIVGETGLLKRSDGSYGLGAFAQYGYVFDHWGGDVSGTDPYAVIPTDGNKWAVAFFVPKSTLEPIEPLSPSGTIQSPLPMFVWRGVPSASSYTVSVKGVTNPSLQYSIAISRDDAGCPQVKGR